MMGIILKFLFYFGYLLTTSYGMTTLTCTQHNTQVQSNTTCVAYLLTKENCSRIALPTIFPNLYKHIHNQLYPEKPSNFTVVPIEYQSTMTGKFYPGANISITPPKTSSIVHIPGFEVNVVSVDRGSRACIIIDFNGTLTAPDIHSKFKVTLKKLLGLYYLDAYSLPKPQADNDEGNYLQAFLNTRPLYGIDYADQQSGQWSTTISYQLMTSQRAIRMWFVAPPPQYNFTEFEVELYSYGNNWDPKEERLFLVRISQLTYTFLNISDGNYTIKVTPYETYWNDNSRCLCKELRNNIQVCGSCTRTYTKPFELIGTDVNHGLACTTTPSCLAGKGLLCINGLCSCNSTYYYWNGSNCEQKVFHGEICNSTSNCRGDLGLSCIKNHCKCEGDHYWSGTKCLPSINHGFPCNSTPSCLAGKGLLCINGLCSCNSTYIYWNGSNCEQKALHGDICSSSSNCRDDLDLSCIKNHCKCEDDHYWSGTKCLPKLGYGNTCLSTMECESAYGLLCIQGQCQCNDSYYWSGINKGCTTKMHYNGACIINEHGCQSSLVCSDTGKCQCKDKIWSEEDGKCVEQYITSIQILAVVVGCLCGIILLVVMGLFIYFRYRRPREKKRAVEHPGSINAAMEEDNSEKDINSYYGTQTIGGITIDRIENGEKPVLDQKSVFLVYTEDHPNHVEAIKAFANFLSVHCKCKVLFAPWCLQKIMEDKFRWIINAIENSDYTIIINSMESFHEYQTWKTNQIPYKPRPESPIGDIFLPAIQLVSTKLGKNFDHSKYIMAYFSYTAEYFVIDDICPGGKYVITKHLDELLSHIHQLNTHNQLHTLTAVGLPSKDSLEHTPEGRKLIKSIKSAGEYQKETPNWFVDKVDGCDSGIDEDLQLLRIQQQMNVLSSPSERITSPGLINHVFVGDDITCAHTLDPSVISIEYNPSAHFPPDATSVKMDEYCGLNNLSGSTHAHDTVSFFPPSSIGDDERLSLEMAQLNERYMMHVHERSISQDEGWVSEIESLGGKSI